MSNQKTVYATITNQSGDTVRIAGTLSRDGQQVRVYPASESYTYGWYDIERFGDKGLTASTLRSLFERAEES